MHRLALALLILLAPATAWASCPSTPTDCPSLTANGGTFGGNVGVSGGLSVGGLSHLSVANVTAAGANQGNATPLIAQANVITAGLANNGVVIPAGAVAMAIFNRSGANNIKVYPNSGAQFDTSGTNVPILLGGSNSDIIVFCVSSTQCTYFSPPGLTDTVAPLDVASVTLAGTAVNALSAGHAIHGGFVYTADPAGICVDQVTTAGTVTGTPPSTSCVVQNQPFNLLPSAHAVSVNSIGNGVSLAGNGLW